MIHVSLMKKSQKECFYDIWIDEIQYCWDVFFCIKETCFFKAPKTMESIIARVPIILELNIENPLISIEKIKKLALLK